MTNRALFDPPQLVANVGRKLELLGLDRSLQPIAELGGGRDMRQLARQRRYVASPDVL